MEPKVPYTLRPMRQSDQPFLQSLYSTTRPDIQATNLPEREKTQLIATQFRAQTLHYHTHFGNADFLIIEQLGKRIGRITIHPREDEIRVVDLAILPEYRSHGIGTKVMQEVLEKGRIRDQPVRIHVDKLSRAFSFYTRLGFEVIEEKEQHLLMECSPTRKLFTG